MKIYYRMNREAVLVRKSREPFPESNCHSDLDMDLDHYRVIVTGVREDGWILSWALEDPGQEGIAPAVRSINERVGELEQMVLDMDYRQMLRELELDGERGMGDGLQVIKTGD